MILLPSVCWANAVSMVPERLQGVVAHGGVAGDCLQDPDLRGPHVIREVFVVCRGPGEKILKRKL